jgi:membrane protease YdiL (CAAX protease family)
MREKLIQTWRLVGTARAGALNYVLAGFLLLWLVFDRATHLMTSALHETGLIVLLLVGITAFAVETLGFRYIKISHVFRALGFKAPTEPGLRAALLISLTMLLFFPALSLATGERFGLQDNWPWIGLGVLAQAGLAQELVFRGYLFRHLRRHFVFRRAALFVMVPFAVGRALMFGTADTTTVIAGIIVAAATALPLAHLYERSGSSLWPPALVSAVTQAALQIVIIPTHLAPVAVIGWAIISAALPYLTFALLNRTVEERSHPQTEYVSARYDG